MKTDPITKSTLTLISLAALVGTASAVQTLSESKNLSFGGGNFGGAASVRVFDDSIPGTSYKITAQGDATATVFGTSRQIASAEASPKLDYQAKKGFLTGNVKVFNQTLTSMNETFPLSRTFRTPTFARELTIANKRFFVGPIPMRVHAGVSLSVFGEVIVAITNTASVYPTMEAKVRTPLDAAVKSSASVDVIVAEAGLRGTLSLLKSNLNGSFKVSPSTLPLLGTRVFADYNFKWDVTTLSGKLDAFARVGISFLSKTFTLNLASWNGIGTSYQIASGRVRLHSTGSALSAIVPAARAVVAVR